MQPSDLAGVVEFLRRAERLKTTIRSGYTSAGRPESVAEHTWRLCLMALVLAPEFPEVDFARLIKICVVHDLGEAIGGDVPAPEQVRRIAAGVGRKGTRSAATCSRCSTRCLTSSAASSPRCGTSTSARRGGSEARESARQARDDHATHAGAKPARVRLPLQPRIRPCAHGRSPTHCRDPSDPRRGHRAARPGGGARSVTAIDCGVPDCAPPAALLPDLSVTTAPIV